MLNTAVINDARAISKGQATITNTSSDRVTLFAEKNSVHSASSVLYAMQQLQKEMQGQAEIAGVQSEEDVAKWVLSAIILLMN